MSQERPWGLIQGYLGMLFDEQMAGGDYRMAISLDVIKILCSLTLDTIEDLREFLFVGLKVGPRRGHVATGHLE